MQTTIAIHSRRRLFATTTMCAGVLVLADASIELARAQTAPAFPPPGQLVDVAGHRMHIRCVGPANASPTVVLEAGGGAFSMSWSRVQELLAPSVRSCAYDRAGLGWSEPGPVPRTMRQEAFELHELLAAAHVVGPLVLVGHSVGALGVRIYAERYGSDVAGMVLVDPTHESTVLYNLRLQRWARIRELATGRAIPEPRREGKRAEGYDPSADYFADELQAVYEARRSNPQPLGERPLFVIAAGKRPAPPGTSDSLWRQLRREKEAQVLDLASLSRNAKFVVDSSSGHQIPSENPAIVARAIESVIAAARAGGRLGP
ncbi:MAG: alpha/beta fold hydrolase [Gemmatimonadaceae bacterium]